MIVAKILAGPPKDVSDAAALWKLHASRADGERILQNLRLLDDALGQSDLVRVFERLGIDA